MNIKLLKKCNTLSPTPLGIKDILIGGNKIIAIETDIQLPKTLPHQVIDCTNLTIIPGLIDSHVHITGAGGEGGPASRTTEMHLSQMIEAATTTVVGCLGTDGFTRSVESVLMKAKSLRAMGVSAWIYTGAYQVPTPTILGDVGKDIAMIDEIIGVGEIAVSDHRSSCPTVEELTRLAEHARVGGMLGGKAGIINLHMGDAQNPFRILYEVFKHSMLKPTQFLPTHCNRNFYIFEDAKIYGKEGYIDLTTCSYPFYPDEEVKPSKAVVALTQAGVPLEHITMSSDGCGSLPVFDKNGNLVKIYTANPSSNLREIIDLVIQENWKLEDAIKPVTSTIADILKLKDKGRIVVGKDADLAILDKEYRICHLIANGNVMLTDYNIITI